MAELNKVSARLRQLGELPDPWTVLVWPWIDRVHVGLLALDQHLADVIGSDFDKVDLNPLVRPEG